MTIAEAIRILTPERIRLLGERLMAERIVVLTGASEADVLAAVRAL